MSKHRSEMGPLVLRAARESECLGKTPGYARYSGYDSPEEEAEYLETLGPIWCDGDPIPPQDLQALRKASGAR
jgi:hypothetical protein